MGGLWALIIFAFLCNLSPAQSARYFVNPPNAGAELTFNDNIIYTIGDTVELDWVTDQDHYSIWLWQQSLSVGSAALGQSIYAKLAGGPEQGSFSWTVTTQSFSLSQSNVFFFAMGDSDEIAASTTSHYFNITESQQSASTSSSSLPSTSTSISSSTTPTSSDTPSSSTSAAPTDTTAAEANQTDGSISSEIQMKIGLGVGIGVGIPLLAICVYLAVRFGKKHRKPSNHRNSAFDDQPAEKPMSPKEVSGIDHFQYRRTHQEKATYQNGGLVELPGEGTGFR